MSINNFCRQAIIKIMHQTFFLQNLANVAFNYTESVKFPMKEIFDECLLFI